MKVTKQSLPPGKYYVGDLCYVLHDVWREVCDLTLDGYKGKEGVFELKDGRTFAMSSTAYGDGTYNVTINENRYHESLMVDSGTLGVILVDNIKDPEARKDLGLIHEFKNGFSYRSPTLDGQVKFGEVTVYTGFDDEDDDDEEE